MHKMTKGVIETENYYFYSMKNSFWAQKSAIKFENYFRN